MLIKHLPEFMQRVKEISCVMQTEVDEIDLVRSAVDRSLNNSFASFADESTSGLDRWEKLLGIPNKAGRPKEDRRREILARLSDSLPYTHNTLDATLTALYGEQGRGLHLMVIDYNNYTIKVYFVLELESSFLEIERLLTRWIPANMAVEIIFVFRRHRALKEDIHRQLGLQTHRQIRKEGKVERTVI